MHMDSSSGVSEWADKSEDAKNRMGCETIGCFQMQGRGEEDAR